MSLQDEYQQIKQLVSLRQRRVERARGHRLPDKRKRSRLDACWHHKQFHCERSRTRCFRYYSGAGYRHADRLRRSDRFGHLRQLSVAYGDNQDEVFLGMQVNRQQNVSEATAQKIDAEVKRLVEEGYNEATRILTEKRADLETLAKGLLEFETLSGDEIKDLVKG